MSPLDHARRAAAANGVEFDEIVVIQETNNVVAWLKPASVVVKVGRWSHSASGLLREHRVAGWLAERSVNVAMPFGAPYVESDSPMVSTLWTRLAVDACADDPDPRDLAGCLAAVHDALADIPIELPDFRDCSISPLHRSLTTTQWARSLHPTGDSYATDTASCANE